MEVHSFSAKYLNQYVANNPPVGQEIKALEDKRWRAWNRQSGLTLGYEIYHKGRTKRGAIGRLNDITITQYKNKMKAMIADIQLHGFKGESPTIKTFYNEAFLKYSKRHHKDQRSVTCNWNRLSDDFKELKMGDVTFLNIENELSILGDKALSNASSNRTLSFVKKMFNLAVSSGVIDKSPALHIKKLVENPKKSIVLNDELYRAYILSTYEVQNQQQGCLLRLTGTTGCRIGEVMSLLLEDISTDNRSFIIRDTKNLTDRKVYVGEVGAETIVLARTLSTNKYLFSSRSSQSGHMYYPRLSHALIEAKLKTKFGMKSAFSIKDLRSTVGTKIYERTGDVKAVQTQLGHKTIGVTADIYLHPSKEYQERTVTIIDNLYKEGI